MILMIVPKEKNIHESIQCLYLDQFQWHIK